MKHLTILITIFLLASMIAADFEITNVFTQSHDESRATVENLSDTAKGFDSFTIDENKLYLLRSGDAEVQCYSLENNAYIRSIAIPHFVIDIAVNGDTLYAVTSDNEMHEISLTMRSQNTRSMEFTFPQQINVVNGRPLVFLANGETYCEQEGYSKGWKFAGGVSVFTEKTGVSEAKVMVMQNGQEQVSNLTFEHELGSIVPVGVENDKVYLNAELVTSATPIQVAEKLICIDLGRSGSVEQTDVPSVRSNFAYNEYKCFDGKLFKMMLTPQSVDLLKIQNTPTRQATSFQDLYPASYHYNDNLEYREEVNLGDVQAEEATRISRTQVMNNAKAYLTASWRATSSNASGGLKTIGGGTIRTPSWVTSGYHSKLPYKWGGFTSVSTFLSKISAGKYAGDSYTKSVCWGDTYCVSVDCSGFVSRAWGTSQKYGTSTIHQVSNTYSYISSLKPGDALNKKGSHIVLVDDTNPSGTVNVIEASSIDWAVSRRTRNLSSMSGYKAIYYKYISGSTPTPSPGKGKLTGVIYDARYGSNSRLSGATVTLSNGQSMTTSSSGVYTFDVNAGNYTVRVSKYGFSASPISRSVASGSTTWGSIGMNK